MSGPTGWLDPLIDVNALAVDHTQAPFHLRALVRVQLPLSNGRPPSPSSTATCPAPFYGRVICIDHSAVILRLSSSAETYEERDGDPYPIIGLPLHLKAYKHHVEPTLPSDCRFCFLIHETTATGRPKASKRGRKREVVEAQGRWVVAPAMTLIGADERPQQQTEPLQSPVEVEEVSEDGVEVVVKEEVEAVSVSSPPPRPPVRPAHRKHRPLLRCALCPVPLFPSEVALYAHLVHQHGVHSCMYCRETCEDAEAERVHRAQHSGGLPLVCQHCGKGFQLQMNLEGHERVHTGERPFACQHCGRAFAEPSNCRRHEAKCETGELAEAAAAKEADGQRPRPFSCSLCTRSFHRRELLRDHERIHSGVQPFECRRCGDRFTQRSHRLTHEKWHCR